MYCTISGHVLPFNGITLSVFRQEENIGRNHPQVLSLDSAGQREGLE